MKAKTEKSVYPVFRDSLRPVGVDLSTFCCILYRNLLVFALCAHINFMSEVTERPFPEKKFYIGHRDRMVHWRDSIFCHGVLTVFQEIFRTTLFLKDLEMNDPLGRRFAISLDVLFLEVFYTTLSFNNHINRQT